MPVITPPTHSNSGTADSQNRVAFATVTLVFFAWGFIACMNDLLIPKFKNVFALNQFQANLVQLAFFGAFFFVSLFYFVISAAKGDPINRIGYKNGMVLGLAVCGAGCLLFYPAAEMSLYPLFLTALLILGGGVTIMQIAANPYVSILGPERTASARLNLAAGINSLGYVLAPLVGGLLLFGPDVFGSGGGVQAVKMPYLGLALAFFALAAAVKLVHLPGFENTEKVEVGVRVFRHPGFKWGCLAIFFYVGSEVTVGSILINYLGDHNILGLPHHEADKYLSFYWGGLMIGRLVGAIALSGMRPSRRWIAMAGAAIISTLIIFGSATFKQKFTTGDFVHPGAVWPYPLLVALSFVFFALGRSKSGATVGIFALVAASMTVFSMLTKGEMALWSIIGIGLFNSIMWSNIFTLSIRGLGKDTPQGSSLLVMMIVGGAVMPMIQGAVMDAVGVRLSLSVVLVGYAYLAFFGFIGSKRGLHGHSND